MEQEVNYIEVSRESVEKGLRQMLKAERLAHWNAQKDAPHGLKSDPYRQLERDGQLNAVFILAEAPKIMEHRSDLPAGKRNYISWLMDKATEKALRWKQQEEAAAAAAAKAAENADDQTKQETADAAPAAPAKKPAATKARKSTTANKKPAKSNRTAAKSNKTSQE